MDFDAAQVELTNAVSVFWVWAAAFLPRLGAAIIISVVGYIGAGWVRRLIEGAADRSGRVDTTLRPVLGTVARYAILIIVGVAALGQLGVQTASILAALGAAGLAIGLALQGTLSNIAAGLMLIWLRPFSVGDYIEGGNVKGTVEEIGLFQTRLRTWDGLFVCVPNAQIWNVSITNYSRYPTRLIALDFSIDYGDDMSVARRILVETALAHPGVLHEPPPVAVPTTLGDSGITLQLRAWARIKEFWDTRWDLTQSGKLNLEKAGITIPFPQQVVHVAGGNAQPGAYPGSPGPG